MRNLIIIKLFKTPVIVTGVLFFLSLPITTWCQAMVENDVQKTVHFFDNNGKFFVNPDLDVSGTPFLLEEWKLGKITLSDNTIFNNIKIRLNLYNQQVHFLKSDNVEMTAPKGAIKGLIIFDSTNQGSQKLAFLSGFPAIDNQINSNFYEILSSSKIMFLKAMRKTIHEDKDDLSGEVRKEFREYDDYYFLVKGESALQRIKRDREFVLNFMKDKKDKIDSFLQTNKISFKSTDDIKKLLDYYNSLF